MEYFIMKTDKRLRRRPQIQRPNGFSVKSITDTSIAYVQEYDGLRIDYPDYLEEPIFLIADKFQKILQKYQPDLGLQRMMLIEKKTGRQKPYHQMLPLELACAHKEESQYDAAGNVKEFVLDMEKVGKQRIFLAKDYNRQLLVRLDVAESILRRQSNGIWFEPVKIAGRGRENGRENKE